MNPKLSFVEVCTGANPVGTVILMHGLGDQGWSYVPMVQHLQLDFAVRFICPDAPMQPVTINGGHVMPAWYDIKMVDIVREPDSKGIRESQAGIEELIAYENSRGIPSERIVLAGFSQGGAITLHAGTRHSRRLAGLIALSTYLPMPELLAIEASPANRDVPIAMAHGTQDPVVPFGRGEESAEHLRAAGYRVDFERYPMEHSICMEELEWMSVLLRKWLGGKASASTERRSSIILT
jgi:phospholipase/carboxylesterase